MRRMALSWNRHCRRDWPQCRLRDLVGWTGVVFAQSHRDSRATPWGHPDLQGTWTNSTITPLERPAAFAGREFLTEEEARKLEAAAASQYDQRSENAGGRRQRRLQPVLVGARRDRATRRTSLVIDPPDGRIPALTPDGQKRAAEVAAAMRGEPSGPGEPQSGRALHHTRRAEAARWLQQQLPDRPDAGATWRSCRR